MINFWNRLKKPIIGLAPMAGITDEPMRMIQAEVAKPDVFFTEFISVEGYIKKKEYFDKHLLFNKKERPIVVQVFGSDSIAFYKTVRIIAGMGFDGIDINMGCPAQSVLEKGGGGALIGNHNLVRLIIESVIRAVKDAGLNLPLSVKTRIGKNKVITEEWITFLSGFPLAEITVHGRLLNQGLSGQVNWDQISKACEIIHRNNIICLGNGGIQSIKDAKDKCGKYGLDGVLIGKGALGNPWIFKNNYIPSKAEILDVILRHGFLAWDCYGKKDFIKIRKHFGCYPKYFKGSKQLRTELVRINNIEDVKKIISKFR
jgi:tRNA-dihydrouridine synthase B